MLLRTNSDQTTKPIARGKTIQIVDVSRNNGHLDDNTVLSLKRRVTNLEIDNANLWNDYEALHEQLTQANTRYTLQDKCIQALRSENSQLKNLLVEMKEDFRNFKRSIKDDLSELKKASSASKKKKDEPKSSSFRKAAITRNALGGTTFNNSMEEEKYELKKSFSNPEFIDRDESMSGSFISSMNDSFDKRFGFSIISEIDSDTEINTEAVDLGTRARYNFFPQLLISSNSQSSEAADDDNMILPELDRQAESAPERLKRPSLKRQNTLIRANSRRSIMQPEKTFQPTRLFENMLVIGGTKENAAQKFQGSIKPKKGDPIFLNPKVLYNYAESSGLEGGVSLPDIEKFLASKNLTMVEHSSEGTTESIFFKVVLKSQRKYKKRFVCPFQPHTTEVLTSKWCEDVESVNPQNKLYAICIKKGDFMVVDMPKKNKSRFMHTDTIYCILTYFPYPQVLFGFLVSVLNLIRRKRKELIYNGSEKSEKAEKNGKSDKKRAADLGALDAMLFEDITKYLNTLVKIPITAPLSILEFPFNDDKSSELCTVRYQYPFRRGAYLELANWDSRKVFLRFSLENIKLILSAILLEKSIIFFSEDMTLLSLALNVFLGLIFPYKYLCTVIPALPSSLVSMCEAPMPFLICINRKEEFFWRKELNQTSQSMFVFMDSGAIFIDGHNSEMLNFPQLDFISPDLEQLHRKINPSNNGFTFITNIEELSGRLQGKKPPAGRKKSSLKGIEIFGEDKLQEDAVTGQKIFGYFREFMERNVVSYLANFKDYNPAEVNDEEIKQKIDGMIQNENVRKFFYEFRSTQGFSNYPFCVSMPSEKERE